MSKTMDNQLVSPEQLEQAAAQALEYARQQGADQAEVNLSNSVGRSVTVRQRELESVEIHNDRSLVVSVYQQHRTGSASSADMSEAGIRQSVDAALSIARQTAADECLGLADAELMATEFPDLQMEYPWSLSMNQMVDMARECESVALDADTLISNSEGASVNTHQGLSIYANSHGFSGISAGTRHSISCSVIAGSDGEMQRDYWYTSNCNPQQLQSAVEVGELTAKRTVRRLGAKQVESCQVPVLYEAPVASSLLSHLVASVRGGALYKKASFMLDKLDTVILPEWLSVTENAHTPGGINSAAFDSEGVATPQTRSIVDSGLLKGYVLSSYTARKLGMPTTANAGGVRNVTTTNTGHTFDQLLAEMGTGLLVTELIGSGINLVTGDYSRGASGFWVENGVIQHPVQEVTIAGNLQDIFREIAAIGVDVDPRGRIQTGSILVGNMTLAGS